MNNVTELRPNNFLKIGDRVTIGTGLDQFEVQNFGTGHPTYINNGVLQNGHEFVKLLVLGNEKGLTFSIHVSGLRLVRHKRR